MYSATPVTPTTMKAMIYDSGGPARMFWNSSYPVPKIGKNDVLVKVVSSSVNPLDYRITESHSKFMSHRNQVVGQDVAGTVIAVGSKVGEFSVGDKVFGFGSGYANYAIVKSTKLIKIPPGVNLADMGVYPLVATTALQALRTYWLDKPNYTIRSILVIGGSGGVGSCLIQMARSFGGPELRIYSLSSAKNADYCREMGANDTIDYTSRDFDLTRSLPIHSLDLIFDLVSGTPESTDYLASGAMLLLKQSGTYVAFNSMSTFDKLRASLSRIFGVNIERSRYKLFAMKRKSTDLETIATMVGEGKLKLTVSDQVPLTETPIRRAIHTIKQRHVRGKIQIKHQNGETPSVDLGYTTPTGTEQT